MQIFGAEDSVLSACAGHGAAVIGSVSVATPWTENRAGRKKNVYPFVEIAVVGNLVYGAQNFLANSQC
jgi:hypothetical protein